MQTSIRSVKPAFWCAMSAWISSMLLTMRMPHLRVEMGKDSFWNWPLYAAAGIMALLIFLLRRDARQMWLALNMSLSGTLLGGALGFLDMGLSTGKPGYYGFAIKWGLISIVFTVLFFFRMRDLCLTGIRPPSLWSYFGGKPSAEESTENSDGASDLEKVLTSWQEEAEEQLKSSRESIAIGIVLIVLGLPLFLFSGAQIGIPWWLLVPSLAVLFWLTRMFARRLAKKIHSQVWGPREEFLEDLERRFEEWKAAHPEEAAKMEAEQGGAPSAQ